MNKWLKSNWIDRFPEFREGGTVRLGSIPFTLVFTVSVQETCRETQLQTR